jgi:hypothetical protein
MPRAKKAPRKGGTPQAREAREAAGRKQIGCWLREDETRALAELMLAWGCVYPRDVIGRALLEARQRAEMPPDNGPPARFRRS